MNERIGPRQPVDPNRQEGLDRIPASLVDVYVWYALIARNGSRQAEATANQLKEQMTSDQLQLAAEKLATFAVREPSDRWHFYTDMKGGHRWRRIASNGELVSASPVAYRNRNAAIADAERSGYRLNRRDNNPVESD